MELLNRSALILWPKKPFWDWLNSIDPEENNENMENDPDVYLLPEFMDQPEMYEWLKDNFDYFFTEQLNGWYVDQSVWVSDRTFEMFNEWFDFSLHTMVIDTVSDIEES